MAHPNGTPANYEVHFLHSGDPRDGFQVMSTDPLVFYSFQTPAGFLSTHTIVTDARGATVVTLNWIGPSALGSITWPGSSASETHMGDLVAPFHSMPDSRAFRCEGPDGIVRTFWWRRLPHGNYDVRHVFVSLVHLGHQGLGLLIRIWSLFLLLPAHSRYLQLYAAHEPDTLIGLFRMHSPPECLAVGNNYATFFFVFLHDPLLLHALLALCLNRWLDREVGLE